MRAPLCAARPRERDGACSEGWRRAAALEQFRMDDPNTHRLEAARLSPRRTTSSARARPRVNRSVRERVGLGHKRARGGARSRTAPDHAVELREQAAHEARRLGTLGEAVNRPLAVVADVPADRFERISGCRDTPARSAQEREPDPRPLNAPWNTARAAAAGWLAGPPANHLSRIGGVGRGPSIIVQFFNCLPISGLVAPPRDDRSPDVLLAS